jgi:DNA-binding NtrC family response regulator
MHSQVLVLSADSSQSETWAAILRTKGLRAKICDAWPEARRLLTSRAASVVLYDDDAPIASREDVLSTSSSAGLPAIVMARELDAEKWMSLFRSGAFDVLRYSGGRKHLCESVEEAMNNSRNRTTLHSSWPRSIFEWTRSKLNRDGPPGMLEKTVHGSYDPK